MAKSNSFGKRENEKKKISKRQEKQKRKEERKSNSKGGAFEDMIAYVDENGVITSTPPDMLNKEEIDLEDIAISTPKKEEVEEDLVYRGRVDHFNESKGYGFIKDLNSMDKYFFHVSGLQDDVREGNIVFFETERGPKGMNAVHIRLKEKEEKPAEESESEEAAAEE